MPLPPAARRESVHTRRISCDGYRRDDGLWDIEAHMTDVKTRSVDLAERAFLPAGEALHDMCLRLTIDSSLLILKVDACIDSAPFQTCSGIAAAFSQLEGIRIGHGWRKQAAERLGGVLGCTHLNELLPVLSTTAFQTLWPGHKEARSKRVAAFVINTCHTWSQHGEVVRRHLPEYYVPE